MVSNISNEYTNPYALHYLRTELARFIKLARHDAIRDLFDVNIYTRILVDRCPPELIEKAEYLQHKIVGTQLTAIVSKNWYKRKNKSDTHITVRAIKTHEIINHKYKLPKGWIG